MNFELEKQELAEAGFSGFVTMGRLMADISVVPARPGVYVVMRQDDGKPAFLSRGTGGFFKGEDPNVGLDELQRNWLDDTSIMYFGKAGGLKSCATLQSRLSQYVRFGQGMAVGHRGGRYIWQLEDAKDLVVCWKLITDEEPRDVEKLMIQEFKTKHGGRRPFANLVD